MPTKELLEYGDWLIAKIKADVKKARHIYISMKFCLKSPR